MSIIKSAMAAISKSDIDSLVSYLEQMSKEEVQELASMYSVKSAIVYMSGSWVEESKGNLMDSDDNVLQENVSVERGYKGWLELHYGPTSLHFASIIPIDSNNGDYDEDYFTPGEMLFAEDYGYPADSVEADCDCKSEFKNIREEELNLDELDEFDLWVDDNDSYMQLSALSISANSIVLTFEEKKTLKLRIHDVDKSVQWFLFSVLFMSSKKSISELDPSLQSMIQEYMECNFDIIV